MEDQLALSLLERAARAGTWALGIGSRTLWWSPGTRAIHEMAADAATPTVDEAIAFYTEESRPVIRRAVEECLRSGRSYELELEIVTARGRHCAVIATGMAIYEDGVMTRLVGSFIDVHARASAERRRRQYEDALQQERELAQTTLAAIADGVVRVDTAGRIVYSNEAAARMIGLSLDAMRGTRFEDSVQLLMKTANEPLENPLTRLLAGDEVLVPAFARLRTAQGEVIGIEAATAPVHDGQGANVGLVFVFRDAARSPGLALELERQSTRDALTGLPNRLQFESALGARLLGAQRRGEVHALLFCDVDRFKLVNERCGHREGDRALRQLTHELRLRLGKEDVLARLGGDEFGVILDDCHAEAAVQTADALIDAVRQYRFHSGGTAFQLGLSIGVAMVDPTATDVDQLLSRADTACFVAKHRGRSRAQLWHGTDDALLRTRSEMDWINRIERAIDEDRIELHAQRIVPLASAGPPNYEVLVRLRERDGRLFMPDQFLPAAARFGLTGAIDRQVLRRTLARIAALEQGGLCDYGYLSVNLAGTTLSDDEFSGFLLRTLAEHAVPPHRIRFEITETSAVEESPAARDFIARLRALGYKILLDDFGTGFTSFAQLKSLGADGLKIDRSFIAGLLQDPVNQAIVESICRIAVKLGLQIVAEGVEDDETLQALRKLGVDHAQGWLFHRAEPIDEVLRVPRRPAWG